MCCWPRARRSYIWIEENVKSNGDRGGFNEGTASPITKSSSRVGIEARKKIARVSVHLTMSVLYLLANKQCSVVSRAITAQVLNKDVACWVGMAI